MSHTQVLIMNKVQKALEELQEEGVGYIDGAYTDIVHYVVDNKKIRIVVEDAD